MLSACTNMQILGFDPGIINIGVCTVEVSATKAMEVVHCQRIDLTNQYVPRKSNSLLLVDRFNQFLKNTRIFEDCDVIVMERQPPGSGGDVISCLLYDKYPAKMALISPRTLHCHFNMQKCDYEGRKQKSTAIAENHLMHLPGFQNTLRKHDISDAFLLTKYYVDKHIPSLRVTEAKLYKNFGMFAFKTKPLSFESTNKNLEINL